MNTINTILGERSKVIYKEFCEYAEYKVNEGILTKENMDEWHYNIFNNDYYIIGYTECYEWLRCHDIDAFEAVGICQQYEIDNFGECSTIYDNSEKTANMIVYIIGEEWLCVEGEKFIKKLISDKTKK